MEPQELIANFGNRVDDLDFFLEHIVPFTVITSEVLEAAKNKFLAYAEKHVLSFKPKVLLSYELEVVPSKGGKYKLTEEDRDSLLNCMAVTLARSGTFKKPAYVFKKLTDDAFLFIDVTSLDKDIKNKLIYVLSPRMQYVLEEGHVESAIINMIEGKKKMKIKKGRGYCFLKCHLLVTGAERPVLKREVQILYDYGMSKISDEVFKAEVSKFRYIVIELQK